MLTITPIDLTKIKKINFPEDQYFQEQHPKRQIVIHHTASGKGIDGDFTHWLNDRARIATCVIIGYDGQIYSLFNSMYWGHHLGIKADVFKSFDVPSRLSNNTTLNQKSIGIELDAWGPLVFNNEGYRSYTGTKVPESEVQAYSPPYRLIPSSVYFDLIGAAGKPAYFYHKYSEAQLISLGQLLALWCKAYDIPKVYNTNMWDVNKEALSGKPGVWTHNSYRFDKNDCAPQPDLIELLKNIP